MPTFDARGFRLYYELHGDGGGVPLVLFGGLGGSSKGWLVLQVPELSRDRPVLVFDPRGTGSSEDPGGAFDARDLAGDAAALLEHLGIERAHVLGQFLGGLAAQELALGWPERVRSLVLAGSFTRLDAKRRMLLEVWRAEAEHGLPAEVRVRSRLVWTLHDDTLEQRELIETMTRFFLGDAAPVDDKVFARQIEACLAFDARDRLASLRTPTLVIAGEEDLLTPPRLSRELANSIPGARLVLMPGVGHLAPAEAAPRFNRLVSRFIAEHDPVSAR
jgi:3-oxoadipate enol-lactonase